MNIKRFENFVSENILKEAKGPSYEAISFDEFKTIIRNLLVHEIEEIENKGPEKHNDEYEAQPDLEDLRQAQRYIDKKFDKNKITS